MNHHALETGKEGEEEKKEGLFVNRGQDYLTLGVES